MDVTRDAVSLGDIIDGRYQLTELVGRGGSGVVFRATDLNLQRDVAVKILSTESFHQAGLFERFEQESKILRKLRALNTVFFYDTGKTSSGLPYIAMEFVVGIQLKSLLEEIPVLTPDRVVPILSQVLSALSEAHDLGFVHRDLKPANIMLCSRVGFPTDFVKVLDFGVARIISDDDKEGKDRGKNEMVGTPKYMPPEQFHSKPLTPIADLYSVGCIAYEMLAGFAPFDGDTLHVTIAKHLFMTPPSLPEEVEQYPNLVAVIFKLLEKEPADRFTSAQEVIDALAYWQVPNLIPALQGCRLKGDDKNDEGFFAEEDSRATVPISLPPGFSQHLASIRPAPNVPSALRHLSPTSLPSHPIPAAPNSDALPASGSISASISQPAARKSPVLLWILLFVGLALIAGLILILVFWPFSGQKSQPLGKTSHVDELPPHISYIDMELLDMVARLAIDVSQDALVFGLSYELDLPQADGAEPAPQNPNPTTEGTKQEPQKGKNTGGTKKTPKYPSHEEGPQAAPAEYPIFEFTLKYDPPTARPGFLNAAGECDNGVCRVKTTSTSRPARIHVSAPGYNTYSVVLTKPVSEYNVRLQPQ